MEQTIFIKSSGVTVVDVLKALSRGLSPEQVVKQFDKLTIPDILATLQMAANVIEQYVTSEGTIRIEGEVNLIAKNARLVNVSKMREVHARAYEPWSKTEVNGLIQMFRGGTCLKDMAETLGRGEGAIKVRLEKLGLLKPRKASQLPGQE
jgi:uncharacterized protein (DUF433 family)